MAEQQTQPAPAASTVPEATTLDNFDEAFEKLAQMVETPPATPESEPKTKPVEAVDPKEEEKTPPPEPETEDDEEDEEEEDEVKVPGEEEDDEEEEVEAKEAKETKKPSDDELLERFAKIVKEKAATPEPAPQPAPQKEVAQQPAWTQEESEFLSTYEKEWPDIAKAESLRRRAEYQQLVGYIFSEIAKEFSPVLESVRTISERTHLQDLQAEVTDYDDVRDKVVDWVAQQPAYLQPAYNHVIQQGTVDEVKDLINRYKADTGVKVASAPAPSRKKVDTELPTATKQAAASLAPVSSKRSAVVTGVDSGDFDSAFSAFADKL